MKYIDLFAGCGGLSLGLHNSGLEGLFAVEKNSDAFQTLKYNLIERKNHFSWPEWLEQKNWDINEVLINYKKNLTELQGTVDLIVGGPPCQGFSMAGERNGDDIRNRLIKSYIAFVRLVKPEMLFFENVHGFTVAFKDAGKDNTIPYSTILINELEKLGYMVDSHIINMSNYGVPQNRKRFILFATKRGNPNSFFNFLNENKVDFLRELGLRPPITIKQAIGDLERANGEIDSLDSKGFKNGKYANKKNNYQKLMRNNLKRGQTPDSHRFVKHRPETIRLFKELMSLKENSIRITPDMGLVTDLKKRGITPLKPSSVSPTITSIPDDLIHYKEPRIMTVREHARIQSFPDDFEFKGKYTTGGNRRKKEVPRYTQVANAVPPLFSEQIGIAMQNFLDNI